MDKHIEARKERLMRRKGKGWLDLILLRLSQYLAYLGGLVLVGITMMTVYSIIGRSLVKNDHILTLKAFGNELLAIPLQFLTWWRPIKGDVELTEIGTAIAICSFLPYCQMVRGNVLVDFFTNKAHPKVKAGMDVFANAIFTVIAATFTWRMSIQSQEMMTAAWKQSSMILKIPTWWGVLAATCFFAFLSLICFFTFLRSVREVANPDLSKLSENREVVTA